MGKEVHMFLMPDVSHWNSEHLGRPFNQFEMALAAEACDAIMIKFSQGTDFIDPFGAGNALSAIAAGLPWGVYHWVTPQAPIQQAMHCLATVDRVQGCQFICADWEEGSREVAQSFVDRIVDALGPQSPIRIGDYIGVHARGEGGQLAGVSFHMVPQYGPAQLNPDYHTNPLSAWQYTDGATNGSDWPSGVPGLGKGDMSAVFRPEDFGMENGMAITQGDANLIVKTLMEWKLRSGDELVVAQALRDANVTRTLVAKLPNEILGQLPENDEDITSVEVEQATMRALREVLGSLDEELVVSTVAGTSRVSAKAKSPDGPALTSGPDIIEESGSTQHRTRPEDDEAGPPYPRKN
jgi:lysozyme